MVKDKIYISLVWVSIHCESKMKSRFYKLWKGDDKIPILQLARFRSKKRNVNETDT